MFPILRHAKSERSIRKVKKGKSFNLTIKPPMSRASTPEVDFTAFRSGLARDDDQSPAPDPYVPHTTPRTAKRDTLLLDLSNNDLIPALDYAFAILEDDELSVRSLPPPPKLPTLSRGPSTDSADILYTPSTSKYSPVGPSIRSSPPRYYVPSPLGNSPVSPSAPIMQPSPQNRSDQVSSYPASTSPFDPDQLSLALEQAQATSSPEESPPLSEDAIPFPSSQPPPTTRVPLLLRKPRMHSAESSMDGHETIAYPSYFGSSKVSLARSVSSLGHHRDVFGARSTASLHSPDPTFAALLALEPDGPPQPYGPLRLFSKKSRRAANRRAATTPPSRTRFGIPTTPPPVPPLPDVSLLGNTLRRRASRTSPSLFSRAVHAT